MQSPTEQLLLLLRWACLVLTVWPTCHAASEDQHGNRTSYFSRSLLPLGHLFVFNNLSFYDASHPRYSFISSGWERNRNRSISGAKTEYWIGSSQITNRARAKRWRSVLDSDIRQTGSHSGKTYEGEFWLVIDDAENAYRQHSTLAVNLAHEKGWFHLKEQQHCGLKLRLCAGNEIRHEVFESTISSSDRSSRFNGGKNYFRWTILSENAFISRSGDIELTDRLNFADHDFRGSSRRLLAFQAVSPGHDTGGAKPNINGAPEGGDLSQKQQQERYLRVRKQGPTLDLLMEDRKTVALDVTSRDIDVSFDGRNWFHAFGPKCIDNLQRLQFTLPETRAK